MARMTHDAQSFLLDNRRIWLVGAGIDYARVHPEHWGARIAAARQAGFNTIVTTCPWLLHEPRRGRFSFTGEADVGRFVELCKEAGLYVGLRVGPFSGWGYDGGGLPPWLRETEDIRMRDASQPYLERVAAYLRKLIGQVSDHQAIRPDEGGVIFVQVEQSWHCTNDDSAVGYLGEVARHVRENGIQMPVVTANDLWAEIPTALETWQGAEQMLVNLRQLRTINPEAPQIVSAFETSKPAIWGQPFEDLNPARMIVYNGAQILASGAQPVVSPFCGGTNFGFLAGRRAGRPDGFTTTAAYPGAPLGEAGARGEKYGAVKRLATFASQFGAVFAELDPDYHPVTVSVDSLNSASNGRGTKRGDQGVAVVPLRGAAGRIVFVFGDPEATGQSTTLLLDHGLPLAIELGDQPVGWYLIDVDLGGRVRLDYANLCPFALVDRSVLVLFGPEKATAFLSVNEGLIETTVPGGKKPRIIEAGELTIVICSQEQIDATYIDDKKVYVGAAGLDDEGEPIAAAGYPQVTVISAEGTDAVKPETPSRSPSATKLEHWLAAPATTQAEGTNPRYASLAGPETLDACGAPSGYGWYRVPIRVSSAKKRLYAIPQCGNRMHLYLDGKLTTILGTGPGASGHIFDLKLAKGEYTIVGLADHAGRFDSGNDFGRRKGWYGHLYEIKTLKMNKPKVVESPPVDPFLARSFLLGQSKGRMTSETQAVWNFTYRRKAPILLSIENVLSPGIFLLNGEPLTWYAGERGETNMRLLITPEEVDAFKRGSNELRFAPDADFDDGAKAMVAGLTIYETVDAPTDNASWAFARWEVPKKGQFEEVETAHVRNLRRTPCWWRGTFTPKTVDVPLWFNTAGLSKGQVFLNGENVGRYFTTTHTNAKVGPQTKLLLPTPWVKPDAENEITIFDEHGYAPHKTKIEYRDRSEFE